MAVDMSRAEGRENRGREDRGRRGGREAGGMAGKSHILIYFQDNANKKGNLSKDWGWIS